MSPLFFVEGWENVTRVCVCVCLCVTAGKNLVLSDNVKLHYINIYLYIINRYHYSLPVKKLIYEKRELIDAPEMGHGTETRRPPSALRRRRPRRHVTYKLRRVAVLRQFVSLDRASRPLSCFSMHHFYKIVR